MWKLNKHLLNGRAGFMSIMPGLPAAFKPGPVLNYIKSYYVVKYAVNSLADRKPVSIMVGELLGGAIAQPILHTPKTISLRALTIVSSRRRPIGFNLDATQRFLIGSEDRGIDGRVIKDFRVVYHEANKAGQPNQKRIQSDWLFCAFSSRTMCN